MLLELFLFLFSIYTATAVDLNWPNGEIDQLYSKLLNLPIEHNAKGYINDENLIKRELLKLELAFFYNASEKLFFSIKEAKLTNVQEKLIEEKRGQFDDLMESVKMEERSTEVNKCKLWKFWRNLQNFLVEQELMDRELTEITNKRDKSEPNLIDCEQIEQILAKNERENAEGKDAEMVEIQIYLQDTKMLTHYHALMHLLTTAQKNESVEENIEWVWYREFVDVFSTKKLDFESNVGYQLRKMRIQNDAKGIVEFKSKVERLMGPNLLAELEVRQPFLMALDLTTNAQLAADYVFLLSKDTTKANIAEFSISIRIYFGRILTIFNKVYLLKQKYVNENNEKMENILSQIEEKWNKNNLKIFTDFWMVNYQTYESLLLAIFEFWQKLALLYNKMPILETDEKILLNENPKNWHEFLPTFQRVRIELIDDHVQNVIKLYEDWLKNFLENSLFEGKGALYRLQQFLFPKSMDNLMEEYSEMKEIFRIKLEDDDITKLQSVNYIIFFDVNSDVKMWKKAQFLLDILANYQWYKWQLKSLSKPQQNIMEQNLAKMEICMDSINEFSNLDKMEETRMEFLNNFYGFRKKMFPNEKTFVSGFEVLSKNAEMDILYKTFSMHEKSLSPLLGNDEFKQKLEEIYIDAERFDGKLHNNSTIFSNLFKHCRGVLNTKEDKEWYELLKKYEALLQTADPLTDSEKKMFNVDTLTFRFRELLKELLNFGRNLKSKNNKKFTRIIIQAAVDVANLGLLVENDNLNEKLEQKLRQKCYFESVLGWLEKNGTLLKNAEWRKYVLHRGFISKDQIPEPSESDLRWSKPDCENNLDPKKLIYEWTEDSECQVHHATFIHDLNQKFPNFYKNVAANILSFPKFRNFATLGEEEEIELYKVILGSDDAKMAREAESRLAIKILIQKAKENEKLINPKFVDEMHNAKAEAYAIVLISDIFCPSTEWPIDRALCPIVFYATYLNDKVKNQHKTNWFMPDACFTNDANAIFMWQQQYLSKDRLEFFKKYLKTNGKNDEIIKILREKSGTFFKLQKLIDQKEFLEEMWDKEEIREKLLNKDFFLDKMRLLNNYRRAMAKSSSDTERLSGRLAADVSVWMNHLSEQFSQRKPSPSPSVSVPAASAPTSSLSSFSELVNYVWLSFRIIYDICDPTIVMNFNFNYNYKRLSFFLNNFLYEFDNFIQNERKKRFTDVLKNWKANEHSVLCISDLGWLNEDANKTAAPLEITQQIHFEVLQKYMDDKEIGKDLREIFLDFPYFIQIGGIILPVSVSKTVGKNNENHEEKYRRKNLLQFLKIENIKKLFELHKITYNESDFMGNESEEEAENAKKMEVRNTEQKESNEKGKRNKKRKIQKRKQKMDKKEDTTKNLMENRNGNKNVLQKTFEENPSESDKNAVENVKKLADVSSVNAAESRQIMGKKDQSLENVQNIEENLSADSKERPFNIVLLQKNAVNFVEKYNNSIVFNCVAEEKISYDKFCNFVEDQIRSEFTALMEKIGIKNSKEIAFLNTESYEETCKIAKELVQEKFSINFCKLWLVGIESPPMHNNGKLNEYLKDFNSAIKSNYLLKFSHSSAAENDEISESQKLRADVHSTVQKKWFLMQIMEN